MCEWTYIGDKPCFRPFDGRYLVVVPGLKEALMVLYSAKEENWPNDAVYYMNWPELPDPNFPEEEFRQMLELWNEHFPDRRQMAHGKNLRGKFATRWQERPFRDNYLNTVLAASDSEFVRKQFTSMNLYWVLKNSQNYLSVLRWGGREPITQENKTVVEEDGGMWL